MTGAGTSHKSVMGYERPLADYAHFSCGGSRRQNDTARRPGTADATQRGQGDNQQEQSGHKPARSISLPAVLSGRQNSIRLSLIRAVWQMKAERAANGVLRASTSSLTSLSPIIGCDIEFLFISTLS